MDADTISDLEYFLDDVLLSVDNDVVRAEVFRYLGFLGARGGANNFTT